MTVPDFTRHSLPSSNFQIAQRIPHITYLFILHREKLRSVTSFFTVFPITLPLQNSFEPLLKKALGFAKLEPTPPASQTQPKLPLWIRLMPVPNNIVFLFLLQYQS
jgi:hypothetical protein